MVYLQLVVGIGCVVVAAAAAVYFSMSSPVPPHQTHRGRRQDDDEDNTNFDPNGLKGDIRNRKRLRENRTGDKCILCLEVMTNETMRRMHCGHALHESPCFQEYRTWRRQCPYCNQLVIRIDLPGEDCAICCEPMQEDTMEYLKCEHALHSSCLSNYKKNNYTTCPVCVRQL
ncbi:uncharacterized protein LOC117575028 [Drosophila albomicans]|uniref:Uncharacterized protein LOC117575028 n=1 Tax=Drosophila albomicans TaxID=7291 RepID=A0A6P8XPF0_DROAB|nr:uncharacterized protein LOC117575028 [Drosophila albomicans]